MAEWESNNIYVYIIHQQGSILENYFVVKLV